MRMRTKWMRRRSKYIVEEVPLIGLRVAPQQPVEGPLTQEGQPPAAAEQEVMGV